MKTIQIQIRVGEMTNNNYISSPDLDDRINVAVGDWSEERLEALLAETSRKIEKAWRYMSDREVTK